MMYLITERADKLVDYVDKITKTQPEQDVHTITKKFTQSCITACAFGLDQDTFVNPNNMLEDLEFKIFTSTHKSKLEMMYPGILKRLGFSLFPREVGTFFTDLTKAIVAQRKGEPTDRNDFMDLMLGLRKAKQMAVPRKESGEVEKTVDMTDDVMAGQTFVFYAAGYQTSATTMAFMLYYLALNPDIQDKALKEIYQVLEKYEGKLNYHAVLELKYMGQVFDETLRLNPSGDNLRRRALSDYKIPGTNLTVKKGQILIIPIPVVHMDPNNYENPEVFDPDRFSPENVAARHSCAYLPFGVGPRHCIGMRFAQVMSRAGMAQLLSKFRVEPSSQTPRQFHYEARRVLYPRGGFPLKLVRRH